MLDGHVGGEICWVGIGGDSRLIVEDLGSIAVFHDVAGQSVHRRNVVDLEQFVDAPSHDDIWMLVESARDESLMERCFNLVVNREPSLYISRNGERLDVFARGLLSRVMGVASQSHWIEHAVWNSHLTDHNRGAGGRDTSVTVLPF